MSVELCLIPKFHFYQMARLLLIMFTRISRMFSHLIRADVDLSSRQQELLEPTWKKRFLFEKMATDQNDHKIGKFQSHIRILVPSNSTVLDYHHFIPSKIKEAYHGVAIGFWSPSHSLWRYTQGANHLERKQVKDTVRPRKVTFVQE